MITPDGTDHHEIRSTKPRGTILLGAAALVVSAGLVLIGTLTSPEPAAVEQTTTTTAEEVESPVDPENFTVSQIATGDPLDWELVMAIDDRYPLELVEHEDDLYLFTGSEHLGGFDAGGLMAWRSSNGADWEGLGQVISADHRITTIDSTMQGLVATAIRRNDGALVLWESGSAVEWTGSEVPTGTQGPYHIDVVSAVGARETTLLLASNARYDRERLLEDRMRAMGLDLELSDLAWDLRWLGEKGQHLVVTGPFDIPVLDTHIDALGLGDEERQELTRELFDPVGTDVWVRNDRSQWGKGLISDTRVIDSIVPTPDDRLIAYGTGTSGRLAKATYQGIEWSPTASTLSPLLIRMWKQQHVGAVNAPDLMVSDDGETWRATGLDARFPDELSWAPITLGAGEGGVAMFVRGERSRSPLQPESLGLTSEEGSPFLLTQQGGDFVLSNDNGQNRWVLNDVDDIAVDLAEKRISLGDPETGEDMVSFSFAELRRASLEHSREVIRRIGFWGIMAYTADGAEWVIQDMAPEIGEHATISLLEVTADRVIAVVGNTLDTLIRGVPPGLEIWSAPIP